MEVRKTYKFRIYDSKKNKSLSQTIFHCSLAYNHCIALQKRFYKLYHGYIGANALQKHLTKLKRTEKFSYLNLIPSQALQEIVQRIDKGYRLFFSERKKGNSKIRPPSFKKAKKYKSFTLKQCGYKYLGNNQTKIGKKVYKHCKDRGIPDNCKVKNLTVKKDNLGKFWFCYSVIEEVDTKYIKSPEGKISGFDFGIKTFLTDDKGNKIEGPRFFKDSIKEIKKLNRSISRKNKGSKNQKKEYKKLARVHKRLSDKRSDFQWKLAHEMTNNHSVLFFETLDLQEMAKNHGRVVSDYGFGDFLFKLQNLAIQKGKKVVFIDKWEPTTKKCNCCGWKNEELTLKVRKWTCKSCGVEHDRDVNAAKNILSVGASTVGLDSLRPHLGATVFSQEPPLL